MKHRFVLLITLALLSLTPQLHSTAQDEPTPSTVRVAIPDVENLDPSSLSRFNLGQKDIVENLFIGLTHRNPETQAIEPALATDWSASDNGLIWTFNLRDDVQWIDVEDNQATAIRTVVADDVVFAIQRACDPTRPSPAADNIYIIAGCLEVQNLLNTDRITPDFLDQTIGVRAVDDQTVEFRLAFPAGYFPVLTTLPEFRPLPRERVLGAGSWPTVGTIATSGYWIIDTWDANHMLLTRNPFWPDEQIGVDNIDIRFDIAAENVALRLSSGTIDVARIPPQDVATLQFAPDVVLNSTAGQTRYMIGFSTEYLGLDDMRVREALARAIDHAALFEFVRGAVPNGVAAIETLTPPTVHAAPAGNGATFDPITAQQLLTNAGFPQCQNMPRPLTLVVQNAPLDIAIGQFVVAQWIEQLGCAEVFELRTAPKQAIIDSAHLTVDLAEENTGRFPLWLVTWTADYPDADAWLNNALHCTFGFFRTGRPCDAIDTLLDAAAREADSTTRTNLYGQVEAAFFGDNGVFPALPQLETIEYVGFQQWLNGIGGDGQLQFDRWAINNN